jgi:large subunit ribosomal protein L25
MATTVQLKGTVRNEKGKGAARRLRRAEAIPGVLYGRGRDPVMLALDERQFLTAVSGHSVSNLIVDLNVGGDKETVKTLIREVQLDPVSGSVLHVDLNEISLTDKIEVDIPVILEGIPSGVKNSGGILQHPLRTLSVRCLPTDLPENVKIDVSALEIGDSIHVSELGLANVEILEDMDTSLASVIPPTKIEEPTPAEGEEVPAEEEEAEPEVVGKKKEEGEGEDEAGADKQKGADKPKGADKQKGEGK